MKIPDYGPLSEQHQRRLLQACAPLNALPERQRKIAYRGLIAMLKSFVAVCELQRRDEERESKRAARASGR